MNGQQAVEELRMQQRFFEHVIQDFSESEGEFRQAEETMSVAQHINHVAVTVDWFREGAFGTGFETDFEKMEQANFNPVTLPQARRNVKDAFDRLAAVLEGMTAEDLLTPLAPNPILGEAPKLAVLSANCDHTAHHRGALAVYLRLLGKTPRMPYEVAMQP